MKRLFLIFAIIICGSCSFDNKTGIWKDASNIPVDNRNVKTIENENFTNRYEDIFVKKKIFNEEVDSLNSSSLQIEAAIKFDNWIQQYATGSNNVSNFFYPGNTEIISKSSKLSKPLKYKNQFGKNIIFFEDNLISYDHKGKIFIYNINLKKKIFEYNFYKKNYKKFEKEIYITTNKNILYVADNLGYLYAINIQTKSLKWAKNYGIPFRSNIKYSNNQIFLANQDNVIYSIDSNTGNKNWQYATNTTFLKANFKNTFALDELNNNLFFLNTSGELYSMDYSDQKIKWILNFKKSTLKGDVDLFLSQTIVYKNNNIIIASDNMVSSFNTNTAQRNWELSVKALLKPILTDNYTYIYAQNDLLICVDNNTGKVIWSKNIYSGLDKKQKKNKIGLFYDLKIVNKKLNLYSQEGYLLSFNFNDGIMNLFKKISKNGINSEVFFIKDNMLLIDNKNRLLKYN